MNRLPIPNEGQENIINQVVNWFYNSPDQIFEYTGGPGTGKTFIMLEIIRRLNLTEEEILPICFTGAASLNMRSKGLPGAATIHHSLYETREEYVRDGDGKILYDPIFNKPMIDLSYVALEELDPMIKLIIVDEGYTVPYYLKKQIERFNVKVLVAGDPQQLPPVGDKPAYLTKGNIPKLDQPMRQADCADINTIALNCGIGDRPMLGVYPNATVITRNMLTDAMLLWADIILCGSNKTRDIFNSRIRTLKGFAGTLPHYGERIICRKNNWRNLEITDSIYREIPLVNGLLGTVVNEPSLYKDEKGRVFVEIWFSPDIDRSVIFKCAANYEYLIADSDTRKAMKTTKLYGDLFEFGYASTTYLFQGSQAHNVIYYEESYTNDSTNQLNLVGASRADNYLIYVLKS